jgi:hypothetical protein
MVLRELEVPQLTSMDCLEVVDQVALMEHKVAEVRLEQVVGTGVAVEVEFRKSADLIGLVLVVLFGLFGQALLDNSHQLV